MSPPTIGQYIIKITTDNHTEHELEFKATTAPMIDVIYRGQLAAQFERTKLWTWLYAPSTAVPTPTASIAAGDVQISKQPKSGGGSTLILKLPDTETWPLTEQQARKLTALI